MESHRLLSLVLALNDFDLIVISHRSVLGAEWVLQACIAVRTGMFIIDPYVVQAAAGAVRGPEP